MSNREMTVVLRTGETATAALRRTIAELNGGVEPATLQTDASFEKTIEEAKQLREMFERLRILLEMRKGLERGFPEAVLAGGGRGSRISREVALAAVDGEIVIARAALDYAGCDPEGV